MRGATILSSIEPITHEERAASVPGPVVSDDTEPLEGGSPDHVRTPDLSTEQLLGGTYSSERLVLAATLLRADGWSAQRIRRDVYAPFIVVGPSSWGDSWHAPRYGPGPIVRQHEGEDVLCRYGAEVLAPEDGTIEFDRSVLGGRSARLYRSDGGYYYFAHFADWNDRRFSDGDEVRRGDVIGFCGDTGNATVPHVHVGWYGADGVAIDPMRRLISWLHEAEGDLPASVAEVATRVGEEVRSGPALDALWALLDDPLTEADLIASRNIASRKLREPIDLTLLVFLFVFGVTARRTGHRPRRGSSIPGGIALRTTAWAGRRGPPLS